MGERLVELRAVLAEIRHRLTRRDRLRAWTVGAAAAATILLVGLLAVWILAAEGLALSLVVFFITLLAGVTLVCALWPVRSAPTDLQLARFIEERAGGMDDELVTAVAHGGTPSMAADHLVVQALRSIHSFSLDRVVSPEVLRRAAIGAGLAAAALAIAAALFAPVASRGVSIAAAYVLPSRLVLEVTPGSTKVRAGQPVTITARVRGLDKGLVPSLVVGEAPNAAATRMTATSNEGEFALTLAAVNDSFPYAVTAGPARSAAFDVTVIRPPRVTQIDLHFAYPTGLGLEPRTQEDGGDIYAPQGTVVQMTVTTDKPVARAALTLADGSSKPLTGNDRVLVTDLSITADGSYRVALHDLDGLDNAGETEYFIRVEDDSPPEVRVLRPGGDKQVTPLEEVTIEVAAEDDFGVAALELVFQSPGKKDTVVPLGGGGALSASGRHQIFLEDLGVQPGDFVTYHARARDITRGRRGVESRSDIFFLEVKPFEEVFRAAQSSAMGQAGADSGVKELAEAQKEIIAATWKLDARSQRGRDAKSAADIKAVAEAQRGLRTRVEAAASTTLGAMSDPRRRRARPGVSTAPGGDDPMTRAIDSMGRAAGQLDQLKTREAVPHELDALNQLLKADSEVKERQVIRQQQAGGGGGNRPTPDMSTLFDQELRKRQETNYETPTSTETREEQTQEDDPLARIRELARRQEALAREQKELAQNGARTSEAELKRQLERLTREQNELRQQAEEVSKQLQRQGQQQGQQAGQQQGQQTGQPSSSQGRQGQGQGQGSQQQQASAGARQMQEVSEQMRNAASNLRRQDPTQASASSEEAVEQLRDLARQIERGRPGERRRATGDLQMESQQIADAERRLSREATDTAPGAPGEDARRRLAAEQERLADRAERLKEAVRQMSAATPQAQEGDGDAADSRQALQEAARELDRQQLSDRMRAAADSLRKDAPAATQGRDGEAMAKALDKVAERLGAATGQRDAEGQRLSEQLARTGELRQQVNDLQRAMQELNRQGTPGAQGQQASGQQGQQGASGQPGQQPGQAGQPRGAAPGAPGQPGQPGQPGAQGQQAAPNGAPQQAQSSASGAPSSSSGQGSQPGAQGAEGDGGGPGGGTGGRAGTVARLQRDVADQMRDAQRLAEQLRKDNPEMRDAPATPEAWSRSVSAPGTEGFKQDFAKWEALKQHLLVALERTESKLSTQLRARENEQRLNAGSHEGVPDAYRELVDTYYRSLATPRKTPR